MRTFVMFALLAFVGCGGGSSSNGGDGGSPSQCNDTATQLCQKAASCSTGHDGGITVLILSGVDGGVGTYGFTINGDVSHCDKFFMDTTCKTDKATAFTATCGPVISGLQCGTDSMFGNGVVIPSPCSQNF